MTMTDRKWLLTEVNKYGTNRFSLKLGVYCQLSGAFAGFAALPKLPWKEKRKIYVSLEVTQVATNPYGLSPCQARSYTSVRK
jgi:hypothetical protein